MDYIDWIKIKRNHMIMQNFAKALWSVFKQYNEKLKVVEGEVQKLREDLGNERTRSLELENELSDLKSHCTCSKQNLVEASLAMVDTSFEARERFEGHICCVDETNLDAHSPDVKEPECSSTPEGCDSTLGQDQDVFPQAQILFFSVKK